MARLNVLGLDPSLNNFGMVNADLDMQTMELTINKLSLSEAKPDTKNKQVRKNCQDLIRCKTQYDALTAAVKDVDIVFCEMPVGSQSARAMASYGMCIGIIASVQKPFIQLTPAQVKLAAVNNKTATKSDMIEWAFDKYPHDDWLVRAGKPINKNEHIADAIACIEAGVATEEFKQLAVWYTKMTGDKIG